MAWLAYIQTYLWMAPEGKLYFGGTSQPSALTKEIQYGTINKWVKWVKWASLRLNMRQVSFLLTNIFSGMYCTFFVGAGGCEAASR